MPAKNKVHVAKAVDAETKADVLAVAAKAGLSESAYLASLVRDLSGYCAYRTRQSSQISAFANLCAEWIHDSLEAKRNPAQDYTQLTERLFFLRKVEKQIFEGGKE